MANEMMTIGNYQIIKEIARGSAGRVYLARHLHLTRRVVAIKLLHVAQLSSQQERRDFLKEASFLDLLEHPYILSIIDVSIHDENPYIVAEYAPNGSLKERIRAIAPSLLLAEEVRKILSQVGQALQYAHERNIVHRDLKPANILFNANEDALLADFSIALKLDEARTQLTDASGTPYYMAPEQFEGIVSKKSDQYGLGCIAYELVTGQRPFNALDWQALAYKHAKEVPIAPSKFNPELPEYVDQAILRALAKDRVDRFEDVITFLAALRLPPAYQAGRPSISQTNIPTVVSSQPRQSTPLPSSLENTPHSFTPVPPSLEVPLQTLSPIEMSAQANIPTQARTTGPIPVQGDIQNRGSTTDSLKTIDEESSIPTQASRAQAPGSPGTVDLSTYPALQAGPITPMPPLAQSQPLPSVQPPLLAGPTMIGAERSSSVISASAPVPGPPSVNSSGSVSRKDEPRKWLILASLISLLVLLIGSSILFAFSLPKGSIGGSSSRPQNHPTLVLSNANVSITPATTVFLKTYAISVVTGTPNVSQRQVGGARLISFTAPSQSQTVNATGQGHHPATQARGFLTMSNPSSTIISGPSGDTFWGSSNPVVIATDTGYRIPAGQTITVPAHAVMAGPSGNIPAHYVDNNLYPFLINGNPKNVVHFTVRNLSAFTGGQNAYDYTTVQQSDINGAVSALEPALMQNAQNGLHAQLGQGEQLVGSMQCTPNVSSNHNAGDAATSVTVTVSVTCTEEAYTQQDALSLAAELLKKDAVSDPNASYILAGKPATSVLQVKGVDANGAVLLLIQAESKGIFLFSDAYKQTLADLISGRGEQDVQQLLLKERGVSKVMITISGGGQTLPINPDQITITVAAE